MKTTSQIMEGKKISFGFTKTKKADKPIVEEKKDFIECVEEKSIKVIGGEEIKEIAPLVIPMKPNTLVTAERLKEIAEKVESALEEPEIVEKPASPQDKPPGNETLDQMVVRELLQDAKKEVNVETPVLTVPLPAKPVNEGEKESTLDDYDAVPIQDFGLAMLRGMGWAPSKEKSTYKQPQLRPKGLGLGADKVVKGNKQKPAKDSKGEELAIVKNAYVKITNGKYSGYYGKILSLDEDNGRATVDIAVKKETVSLSEFMMQPVHKTEFDKESKVINAGSFEEYKKKESKAKEEERSSKSAKEDHYKKEEREKERSEVEREATTSRSETKYDRDEKSRNAESDKNSKNGKGYDDDRRERERDRSHRKQRRDSTEERSSRKKERRHSSCDSLESLSDSEKRSKKKDKRQSDSSSESERDKKKKNKKKERRRHDSSDSESDYKSKRHKTPEGKRDIDKKRKGKKKKRDRDRSPNYRKHRK